MALNIPPMAFIVLRYGAVAVAGFAAARFAPRGTLSPAVEAEMDATPDGMQMCKAPGQLAAAGKITKTLRVGRLGPMFRVDGTALARLKIRRLT
ncbi:hypothetical protein [Jannaschia sp. CCS1]|uniref:hypothetical protein n=1 Tax=Jannaschia sp. (strain CCS1) TaxID=290400 RepID=UPI000053C7C5|nr:hypothetical protein [Jannaschia sp. CCS1]ABD53238.1 hypothetical protein Jann_0321 [Jannaschia sp. CCS1]